MEGEAQDTHEEVDGVAGQVPLGPTPVTLFDDQAGIAGQGEVARVVFDQFQSTFPEQWGQRSQSSDPDRITGPNPSC